MKAFCKRYVNFIGKYYILFLAVALGTVRLSMYMCDLIGEDSIASFAMICAFCNTVCMFMQFADKIPLAFVQIKDGSIRSPKRELGESADDIKREQIKRIKKKTLYAAAVLFPVTVVLLVISLIMIIV
jgi:hypothetical protein